MKLQMNFEGGVINIPMLTLQYINAATKRDLAVLITVMTEPRAAFDFDMCRDKIAEKAKISPQQLDSAIAFWRGAGVISLVDDDENGDIIDYDGGDNDDKADKEDKNTGGKPVKSGKPISRTMPEISSADVEKSFAESPERLYLIDACQQTMGKMFSTAEASVILGLHEYMGLDDDYILTLTAHCAGRGKKTVKYVEKMAISLYERDIETTAQLEQYLDWLDKNGQLETKIRKMMGLGERALSKKEKTFIETWSRNYKFGYEMIEAAYEATVGAIGKASMPYMDKILASWHERGLKTPEEAGRLGKSASPAVNTAAFDTDDFFRLAVARGLQNSANVNPQSENSDNKM